MSNLKQYYEEDHGRIDWRKAFREACLEPYQQMFADLKNPEPPLFIIIKKGRIQTVGTYTYRYDTNDYVWRSHTSTVLSQDFSESTGTIFTIGDLILKFMIVLCNNYTLYVYPRVGPDYVLEPYNTVPKRLLEW